MDKLTAAVKNLPPSPGVYKFKDKENKILYVGKAKDLRKRVSTYFKKDYQHSTRTKKLIEQTTDIEFIQTDTELEALLLENNLIKELRPKYNILMKDDKSYVYIAVNLAEDFPRIRVMRERELKSLKTKKGLKLFGPKLASSKVYETLRILKKLFPFRHCNLNIKREPGGKVEVTNRVIDFPCLDYFIKRCPGPCIGAVEPEEYKKIVQQIMDFLGGKTEELENSLREQMQAAASQKLFEKAAKIRDKLFALEGITERQKVTDLERRDTDVINFTAELGRVYFNIFMIRGGKLISQENFVLDALEMHEKDASLELSEILESFLLQYYEKAAEIPKEILIPQELEDQETLQNWLSHEKGEHVTLLNPKKGEKNQLLELSLKNAIQFAKQYRIKWMAEQKGEMALDRLMEILKPYFSSSIRTGLVGSRTNAAKGRGRESERSEASVSGGNLGFPQRIEGYDISHLGGNETVGSMVVFQKGLPKSSDYRHFKLRTVQGKPDDYKSMEEVLMRRLKYLAKSGFNAALKIKKPSKKDFQEICGIIETEFLNNENLEPSQFLCAKKDGKIAGFGRIQKLDAKVSIISSLWVAPEERGSQLGYRIMEKLIAKSKLKKIYIDMNKKFEEYFAVFGFIYLKNPPEVLIRHAHELDKKLRVEGREIPQTKDLIYMIYEAAKRKSADPSFSARPDLLIIDGGKGQLGIAILALKRLKLEIPVISLAKRLEEIYIPGEKAPLLLEEGDEALKLLQRIRDESHRFAITFQRNLHRKGMLQ